MWYKEYEIINTGKGYIIEYGHYDDYINDENSEITLRKITSYTTIYYIKSEHEYLVNELVLNYIIPNIENYLYSGIIHFSSVDDCKALIDNKTKPVINKNRIEDYSTVYNFETRKK